MPNFTVRTSRPVSGNKCYMTKKYSNGWSSCIRGKCGSTGTWDKECDVLANCVGYACGRFNEIYNEITKYQGMKYASLNCNAENFIERALSLGLKILGPNETPVPGGIMVFQKGNTLSGDDGAGHVMIPEIVYDHNNVYTSESGYGGTSYWNQKRTRGSNNRWGMGSSYKYRGEVINPAVKNDPVITPNVNKDTSKDQIEVLITDLRVRTGAGTNNTILGFASKGYYNYYESKDANGYKWYRIADGQWIASKDGWTKVYPKTEPVPPAPVIRKFKKGDKVIFTGTLYRDSYGNGPGQSRTNLHTTIYLVSNDTKSTKPYNINSGLGWVAEADLKAESAPSHFNPGDTVTVNGVGRATAKGTGNKTGNYKDRKAKVIYYRAGEPYPYALNCNNNMSGVTGWFTASSVK